jgi:hypothetical protein
MHYTNASIRYSVICYISEFVSARCGACLKTFLSCLCERLDDSRVRRRTCSYDAEVLTERAPKTKVERLPSRVGDDAASLLNK